MAIRIINEDNGRLSAPSTSQAWRIIRQLSNDVFDKDYSASKKAGYSVYRSVDHPNTYVSDLGDRLELNAPEGTRNIWIDENSKYTFDEYELDNTLDILNDILYTIEDKISGDIKACTNLGQVEKLLRGTWGQIKEILDRDFPDSELYFKYNL